MSSSAAAAMDRTAASSFRARAVANSAAVESTELGLSQGDIVTIEEVNDQGWCFAVNGSRKGWVPLDYVERIAANTTTFDIVANTADKEAKAAANAFASSKQAALGAAAKAVATGVAKTGAAAPMAAPKPAVLAAQSKTASNAPSAAGTTSGNVEKQQAIQYGPGDHSKDPNYKRCKKCNRWIVKADLAAGKLKAQCLFHPGAPTQQGEKLLWGCCRTEKSGTFALGKGWQAPGCSLADHDP